MRYSVLLLTYNRLALVERCFDSLRPSLPPDSEVWVWDNGSDDGTREYVAAQKDWYSILSPENVGVAGARHELVKLAKGERVIFLDSDTVIFDRQWLEKLDKVLEAESVGVVGPFGSMVKAGWTGFVPAAPGLCDCVSGACQMIKREVINAGAQIDTGFAKFWSEDSDLAFQILDMGYNVACVPINIMHIPAHSGHGQEPGLHEANFARLRERWQGRGVVKCEGGW